MKKTILVLVIVGLIAACAPLEPKTLEHVSFKDLMADKKSFSQSWGSKAFDDGVVIFISEDEDFFAVTYLPVPKVSSDELKEEMYMMVKSSSEGLAIGDVVTVVGRVDDASGTNESGERITVYYLDTSSSRDVYTTGHIDTTDPDFEKLVEIINREETRQFLTWIIVWYIIIYPTFFGSD